MKCSDLMQQIVYLNHSESTGAGRPFKIANKSTASLMNLKCNIFLGDIYISNN